MFGEVIFSTRKESGAFEHSFFEWRVKETIDQREIFIAVMMKPDGYAGIEGSPTNYINFDLNTAVRLRDSLNRCIEFTRQRTEEKRLREDFENSEIHARVSPADGQGIGTTRDGGH